MRLSRSIFLAFALGAIAISTAFAEEEDVYVDEEDIYEDEDASVEEPLFDTTPEILVKGAVASAFNNKLPIGKDVSVLCGMINDHDEPVHVMGIAGTVNDPMDYSRVLMNFTGRYATPINQTLHEDSEMTYAHTFRMPADLEQQSLTLSLHIFYVYDRQEIPALCFNETVEFVRVDEDMDADTVGKFIFSIVAAIIIAWIIYKVASRGTVAAKPTVKVAPAAQRSFAEEYASIVSPNSQKASKSKGKKSN